MVIKKVEVYFRSGTHPCYQTIFTFEDDKEHWQNIYDNKWGQECLLKVFGLKIELDDIDFFSSEVLWGLKEVGENMANAECGLIRTKNNYIFLKLI